MVGAENPSRREKPRITEQLAKVITLDLYRPTLHASSIKEIDFSGFNDASGKRVNTLLLDFEGTCVPYKGWDVDPEIINTIKSANFENIAIVTNAKPKDEKSLVQLNWWARQVGASIVMVPTEHEERKPSPIMLQKAMMHFGITPDQAVMVGDKLTADIAAANRAGVKSVYVQRLGDGDVFGDKYGRRPAEKVLFERVQKRMKKKQKLDNVDSALSVAPIYEIYAPERPSWFTEEAKSIWEKSVVNGFGEKPKIVLPQEVENVQSHVDDEVTVGDLGKILKEADPVYKRKFDMFMYNHGRKVAMGATLSRIPGALLVAWLITHDHPKTAQIAHIGFSLTDGIDGWAARKDKDGPSKLGGKLDHWIDKIYTAIVEEALIKKGYIKKRHRARTVRDVSHALAIRPAFQKITGIEDTKAVLAGKASTFGALGADFYAMTNSGQEHTDINDAIQDIATLGKLASVPASIHTWLEQDELRKQIEVSYQNAKNVLLAA